MKREIIILKGNIKAISCSEQFKCLYLYRPIFELPLCNISKQSNNTDERAADRWRLIFQYRIIRKRYSASSWSKIGGKRAKINVSNLLIFLYLPDIQCVQGGVRGWGQGRIHELILEIRNVILRNTLVIIDQLATNSQLYTQDIFFFRFSQLRIEYGILEAIHIHQPQPFLKPS